MKANQGMRQPQLGGINGDLSKQGIARSAQCRHTTFWRRSAGHPWRCAVCHPPADPAWLKANVLRLEVRA